MLNPELYDRLKCRLHRGVISISKAGESAIAQLRVDAFSGRVRHISNGGEEYVCLCPFCGDQRGHLYINHQYGVYDPISGSENFHLAHCFRQDCLSDSTNRELLSQMIFSGLAQDRRRKIRVLSVQSPTRAPSRLEEVKGPGKILHLSTLEPDHPVVKYLSGRGYDVKELNDIWKLGFAIEPCQWLARNRIFIPAYMHGKLVGWQARYPGYLNKHSTVQKYHCMKGMPKSLILYNYDLAKLEDCVVICEGPSDVWRVGKAGVALMGKTASNQQLQLLASTWTGKPVVILLDSDAKPESAQLYQRLKGLFPGRLVRVDLPAGRDPGDFPRHLLWDLIGAEAEIQGVKLPGVGSPVAVAG
jgi:hypothetical protein